MLGKPLMFLSSYSPLFALLAIRFTQGWLVIVCGSMSALGVAALFLLFKLDSRSAPGAHELKMIRDAGSEAGAYLGGYLLPFLTVSTPSVRDVVAYGAFLAVAASIHLHSSVVQINPLLYVCGYRVLQVTDTHGLRAYLVTRRRLDSGQLIEATRFRDDVLIDRTPRGQRALSTGV